MHDGMSSSSGKSNRDTGSNYGQFDRAVSRAKNNPTSTTTGGGNGGVDPGFQNALRKQAIAKKNKEIKDAQEAAGFYANQSVKYSPPTFASKYNDFRNYGYQKGINLNKVAAMRKMGLMKKGLPGMYGAILSGVTGKVPDWAQNMTEEELTALGADIQGIKDYNQATYNPNLNPTNKRGGSNLLGRTFEAQKLLDDSLMKQTDYDRLFPGPVINQEGNGDNNQPYLPINYNTGAATIEDVEPYNQFTYDEDAFGPGGKSADVTRASYIFNKGGRVPAMEGGIMGLRARRAFGGIMDRVTGRRAYGLGSIFKGVKKAVSGVVDATKKVLKSDIGKAALLYAGGTYLGGTAMFGGSGAGFSNFSFKRAVIAAGSDFSPEKGSTNLLFALAVIKSNSFGGASPNFVLLKR